MLTEEQVERRVERHMDHLDRLLMAGQMPQRDYDLAVKDLNEWAERRGDEAARHAIYTGLWRDE